jgi:hypothetical protein
MAVVIGFSHHLKGYTMANKHDETARRLARKEGTSYNQGAGADVQGKKRAIEVESASTASEGLRQLQGHQKPVYIAGVDQKTVNAALEATRGTTVGVMDNQGNIKKQSTRGKR